MRRKIRLTENDLHRIVNRSVKRVLNEGGYRKYNYNSQDKALDIEKTLYTIEKLAHKLQQFVENESEFGGRIYDVGECGSAILHTLDQYGFSEYGWDTDDYYDYENNPSYDQRDLGDYGTDRNGNWMYDEDPEDEGYQYWLDNTRKGRRYAKQNNL